MGENSKKKLWFLRHAGICLLIFMATYAGTALAQDRSSTAPFKRFSIGMRLGRLATKQVSVGQGMKMILGDPKLFFENTASAKTYRWVWGGALGFNVMPRFGVTLDFLRRRLQFEHSITVVAEDITTSEASFVSRVIVRTQAKYLEIPVFVRYYFNSPNREPRFYLSGGPVFRRVSGAVGTSATRDPTFDEDDPDQITSTTPSIAQNNTTGAGAALGLQIVDDVGIKLEIEGRFTRWLSRSVSVGSANSYANQAEVMVGLTF